MQRVVRNSDIVAIVVIVVCAVAVALVSAQSSRSVSTTADQDSGFTYAMGVSNAQRASEDPPVAPWASLDAYIVAQCQALGDGYAKQENRVRPGVARLEEDYETFTKADRDAIDAAYATARARIR
jgi:hypothetical protein